MDFLYFLLHTAVQWCKSLSLLSAPPNQTENAEVPIQDVQGHIVPSSDEARAFAVRNLVRVLRFDDVYISYILIYYQDLNDRMQEEFFLQLQMLCQELYRNAQFIVGGFRWSVIIDIVHQYCAMNVGNDRIQCILYQWTMIFTGYRNRDYISTLMEVIDTINAFLTAMNHHRGNGFFVAGYAVDDGNVVIFKYPPGHELEIDQIVTNVLCLEANGDWKFVPYTDNMMIVDENYPLQMPLLLGNEIIENIE